MKAMAFSLDWGPLNAGNMGKGKTLPEDRSCGPLISVRANPEDNSSSHEWATGGTQLPRVEQWRTWEKLLLIVSCPVPWNVPPLGFHPDSMAHVPEAMRAPTWQVLGLWNWGEAVALLCVGDEALEIIE